jgi:Domain of unknown function (DUF4337)
MGQEATMAVEVEIPEEGADKGNRKLALLIAILALFLALAEIGGKQADGDSVAANIEASNLWSFFQAKTIRRADTTVAAEAMTAHMAGVQDPVAKAVMQKQIDAWRANAARLESEPDTNEGRKELMVRAKASEAKRDILKSRSETFEIASALLQIGIVVASAAIITSIIALAWVAGGLGIIALGLMSLGMLAPTALSSLF